MRLFQLLQQQKARLNEVFGDDCKIEDDSETLCRIRTAVAEVQFSYDGRDRWITSYITPLGVPAELQHPSLTETWMSFRGKGAAPRCRGEMDAAQVTRELASLAQVMTDTFSNRQSIRDGAYFCHGYQAAYNDFYSGRWDAGD